MQKLSVFLAAAIAVAPTASAVIIRHDVDDQAYKAVAPHPAMFDMRHQGHGVLIAPDWVVTAAHVVFYDYRGKTISLGGTDHEIDHVIFHSGYSKPAEGLFTGHSGPSQAYLRANHDIALVKLKRPVEGVAPAPMLTGDNENGATFTFLGKGNTGNGISGQVDKTGGTLRSARNVVTQAADQWLTYTFDESDAGLPNEGMQGDGDSGGPAFITVGDRDYLAGLVSWDVYDGEIEDFKGGLYGMQGSLVRLSYYQDWIKDVMNWSEEKLSVNHNRLGAYQN